MNSSNRDFNQKRYFIFYLSIAVFFWAVGSAFLKRWVSDDAFISFRYARNLMDGHGLVFNSGEYVEGYTNFLWTVLISFFLNFKLEAERISMALGILFYSATLLLMHFLGRNVHKDSRIKNNYLPIAFFGYALHSHSQVYATGGLETSFFTLLIYSGLSIILVGKERFWLVTGFFILTLASLTRPEGILFYLSAAAYVFIFRDKAINWQGAFIENFLNHFFFLFIYAPYFLWKYNYYGWIFPNTYYAKGGDLENISQGIKFTFLYFNSYYVFYIVLFVFFISFSKTGLKRLINIHSPRFQRRRNLKGKSYKEVFHPKKDRSAVEIFSIRSDIFYFGAIFLYLIPSLIYIIYLTKIGGDFMFGRLFIHITPLLYSAIEFGVLRSGRIVRIFTFFIIITATLGYFNPYRGKPFPEIDNITSENDIYRLRQVYSLKVELLPLRESFEASGARIAFGGSQAMMAYYLNPNYALEAVGGLTDSHLAHLPLEDRRKPGHERIADLEYLMKQKINIHFYPHDRGRTDYNQFRISELPGEFRIIIYDRKVFEILAQEPRVKFVRFEKYLDRYIKNLSKKSKPEVYKDYLSFKSYYFDYNDDPEREKAFKAYLR